MIGFLIAILMFAFTLPLTVDAQTPTGVPSRTPDPSSGCTGFENTAQCRPEWASAISKCITGTINQSANTCEVIINDTATRIAVCSPTNTTGPCRPERVNPYAAGTIARQAETMGKSVGYDITCSASRASFWGTDTNTGLDYFMNSLCSIAGTQMTGISAELLVNSYPNSWQTLATEIKSTEASITCGGIQYVFFNTDGTYRCLPRPTRPTAPTTPTVPTTPTAPTTPTYVTSTGYSYSTELLNTLYNMVNSMRTQLASIGATGVTTGTTAMQTTSPSGYTSSVINLISQMTSNLQSQLASISTTGGTTGTGTTGTQTGTQTGTVAASPYVDLTLANGAKNGVYSVGDTIYYYATMRNVDSIDSFYTATPGDTCVGGSNRGEQKPWIAKAIAETSVFNDQVQSCQTGNTYVITLIGRSNIKSQPSASTISVYIR